MIEAGHPARPLARDLDAARRADDVRHARCSCATRACTRSSCARRSPRPGGTTIARDPRARRSRASAPRSCNAINAATERSRELAERVPPNEVDVLSREALAFVAPPPRAARGARRLLLGARGATGCAARYVRSPEDFKVAPAPADLHDRRVEITGPADRKMMINALNSGAQVFMADFEDACSPTWDERRRGPAEPARRRAPHDRARHRPRRATA